MKNIYFRNTISANKSKSFIKTKETEALKLKPIPAIPDHTLSISLFLGIYMGSTLLVVLVYILVNILFNRNVRKKNDKVQKYRSRTMR